MNFQSVISRKQSGHPLSPDEISFFIQGYIKGEIPDYQVSALLMAIYFQGMTIEETVHLTRAMMRSGEIIDFTGIPGKRVDKHSTGGVGDKLSLLIAPTVSACGLQIPMISGRALGHTGGTLDKLESIPGFNIKMSAEEICRNTIEIGAVMVGQSEKLVPADMKIYALRDVTCTVKSFPLITASILSKKAAEGIDALVMDVKVGEGAIFPEPQEMETLAHWLVQVGNEFGIETVALLTDMDQPLGYAVGNWLEVKECIDILKSGTGAPDLLELNRVFCGKMLKLGGIAKSDEEGMLLADSALKDGKAFAKFRQIAQNQGGDVSFLDNPEKCPPAKFRQEIIAPASGYISQIHARKVGELSMLLGAGRARKEDAIDYTAGVIFHKKVGDYIEKGEILAVLFSNSEDKLEKVAGIFEEVFEFSDTLPDKRKLIIKNIVS